ncbi:MAG: hypothetical protein LC623_01430 [Halobacteriales archaeon]|nr:hypothetical protein [Halobacteriales archaeon]
MRARLVPLLLSSLLLAALLPTASANPLVPYCAGTASPVSPATAPAPALSPAQCKMVAGRVFPEANAQSVPVGSGQLPATDYVSYFEARAGLLYLAQTYPDWVNVTDVAQSYGLWNAATQQRDHFPVMVVQVTNHKSPIPIQDRQQLLFMLSIHGVEKGGREGGLRVIEDLVSGMGIATQKVQNGAGLKAALQKPTGGPVETYRDYLDFTNLVFLFPNSDGWAHDELPYTDQGPASGPPTPAGSPGRCGGNGQLMCRTNGNGTDLNRQTPTIGWALISASAGRLPVNEPEPQGYLPWLKGNFRFNYAIDIHGMSSNYILAPVMMAAGSFTPQEMLRSTALAETLKQRLNTDPFFATWTTALGTAEAVGAPVGEAVADSPAGPVLNQSPVCSFGGVCANGQSPTTAAGSHLVADWGTVWDSIGYTDSGFSGDFFAQNSGLNAPGYDIEMAYNHLETDSQYEHGNQFNGFHVEIVRHIVKSFMDAAAQDVQVSVETHGTRTVVLKTSYVATNLDDTKDGVPHATPGGWADKNPFDDPWQYSPARPFSASPAKYWTDLQPFLRDGDRPGQMQLVDANGLTAERLGQATSLVIPGSAIKEIEADQAKLAAAKAYVEGGGNLVLTDEGMRFLDLAGITDKAVDRNLQYAGAINMDRSHELTKGVRGVARQTYEPVPLGFSIQSNSAPTWYVDAAKLQAVGGDVAGYGVQGQAGGPETSKVTLGQLKLGKGAIRFIGALLPDPTEEFYHPYGLDDYASTYSGNQILRNMLGWEETFQAPPIVIQGDGKIVQSSNEAPSGPAAPADTSTTGGGKGTPGLEAVAVLAALGAALLVARRRQA